MRPTAGLLGSSGGSGRGPHDLPLVDQDGGTWSAIASRPEASSMPLDNGRRLYQHHDARTPWPDPIEASPQDPIRGCEPHSDAMLAPQNAQLMAESKDLQFQIGAIPQTRRE